MVKYWTQLIIEKMQIKNSTLCSLGWLVIKKKKKRKKIVGKDVENLEPLHIAGENVKWFSYCVKQILWYLKKLNVEYSQAVPLLGMYVPWRIKSKNLNRYLCACFHWGIILNSQKIGNNSSVPSTGQWLKCHMHIQWSTV